MQVWTSHYTVAWVLSLIHCYWPHSHLSSFTLLILCLPHLTSRSLWHTHAHTCIPIYSHTEGWVVRQTKPLRTTIFIHLSCSCVHNLEWWKLFYKILLIHYLLFFPFVCSTHHSFVVVCFEHERGEIFLQDMSWKSTNSMNHSEGLHAQLSQAMVMAWLGHLTGLLSVPVYKCRELIKGKYVRLLQ